MKRSRLRTAVALAALLALAPALFVLACRAGGPGEETATRATLYHCPMHPTYVSDRPGTCPICKMDLVPIEDSATEVAGADAEALVSGRAMVALSPERRQLLGVRSEPVGRRRLVRTIRTVGRVAVDERRIHHVHTKYEAWVEALYVNFTGQMVNRGDPLAAIYSPELVASQQEYLLAFRAKQRLAASGIASVARGGADLLEAARQRLLFWDVDLGQIAELERSGIVQRTIDLHAGLPGYVIQKGVVHGMRVTPADILFDIADLSEIWILADVYEQDLAAIELGMPAGVTLPYQPGRTWRGPVTYVNPTVEPGTRTVKVRVEVDNRDHALKPDMFADVVLTRDLGEALFVPDSAILKPGDRRLVFVDQGDGRLEPREITVGARVEDGYQVLTGLAEGERVVTSANFLIDSESSLKAALGTMGPASAPSAGHAHGAASAPEPLATPPPGPDPPRGAAGSRASPGGRQGAARYACPMHPEVTSPSPGACPKCGMELVRR